MRLNLFVVSLSWRVPDGGRIVATTVGCLRTPDTVGDIGSVQMLSSVYSQGAFSISGVAIIDWSIHRRGAWDCRESWGTKSGDNVTVSAGLACSSRGVKGTLTGRRKTGVCRKRKDRPDRESNPGHPYFMKGVLTTTLPSRFVEESSTPTGWWKTSMTDEE
jgi:hypothetical protein